jgi:cholest-4-en-3-one 26-monooxygenase
MENEIPRSFRAATTLIAARREHPTDDLDEASSCHAEIDGERLEVHEIVMGVLPARRRRQRLDEGDLLERDARPARAPRPSATCSSPTVARPSAVEGALRMFPAFAHFRRTATRDAELNGAQIRKGDKVVLWFVSSNRDGTRYEDPDRFDVTRNPEHQAFGAGGRHFCLGTALARLELNILLEETLARYPRMELAGDPDYAESPFINQLKTLPVRLNR